MKFTKKSSLTGIEHTMELNITEAQVLNWEQGELIQNAMPNLSKEDREFLISGITPEEWKKYFGAIEDEEEEEDDITIADVEQTSKD